MHKLLIQACLLSVLIGTISWSLGCGEDKKGPVTSISCEGIACWDPPGQTCAEDNNDGLSVYNAVGWCAEGICDYASREEACIGGMCVEGLCEETPCLGTTCATAPDYRCVDENTLLVYNPLGYCASSGGIPECRYADKGVPCENGCEDGACKGDPCLHKICFKPPARHCDGSDVIVWDSIGGCEDGECVYGFQAVTCASGCENGHCIGTDPCSVMTCNVQPASFCVNQDTLRAYDSSGTCADGACYYTHREITCANGCEGGQCKEQECAGVICDIPIASYCRGGGSLNHWDGLDGACEEGVCSYQSRSSACAPVCSDAKCEDDPCIGIFCKIPPANYCVDETTLLEYDDTGACSDGYCGYESDNTVCDTACDEGDCVTGGDADTDADTDTDANWSILPTSQTLCYSIDGEISCVACDASGDPAFCGQDALYTDNVREYICKDIAGSPKPCADAAVAGDIVEDSLTLLNWQRVLPAEYGLACGNLATCTWDQALSYCDGLTYGGSAEWRLPNYYELLSIVDFGRYDPAIDPEAFPGISPSSSFWTSSPFVDNTDMAWEYFDGNGGSGAQNKTVDNKVRCVRGGVYTAPQDDRYDVSSDEEVVLDRATGLEWAKVYEIDRTWQQALRDCEGLDYGGHLDWRLPNVNELHSLVDIERVNPASSFPEMPAFYFWSSSSGVGAIMSTAWSIQLGTGQLWARSKITSSSWYSRCVRGQQ